MAKRDSHPIPEATADMRDATAKPGMSVVEIERYDVCEWCPTPEPTVPPTQVHVFFKLRGSAIPLFLRFKSAGELDRFIAVLTRHRLGVWPQKGA